MSDVNNPEALPKAFHTLTPKAVLAFGLSCVERMYPNYVQFSRYHDWGDSSALRLALDAAWCTLTGPAIPTAECNRLLAACRLATPDTEEFESDFVSPALDAACAVQSILEFLLLNDKYLIVSVALLSFETIDMFVRSKRLEEREDNAGVAVTRDEGESTSSDPLIQRECKRQRQDIERLQAIGSTADTMHALANDWRGQPVSNIGLSV